MASRPKVIRLSESSPPPDVVPEEEPPEKKPDPRSLIGGVMEKGFSSSPSDKVSIPQPRVTPFPAARHRSEGPYWAPSKGPVNSTAVNNSEEEAGTALADFAEPLIRSKGRTPSGASQWRSNRRASSSEDSKPVSVDTRSKDSPGPPASAIEDRPPSEAIERRLGQNELARLESAETSESGRSFEKPKKDSISMSHIVSEELYGLSPGEAPIENFVNPMYGQPAPQSIDGTDASRQESVYDKKKSDQLAMMKARESQVIGNGSEEGSVRGVSNMGSLELVDQEIDEENRKAVLSMSVAEVAEAQAELSERLRPQLLDMLRRRGLEKDRKRSAERPGGAAAGRLSEDTGNGTKEETSGSSRSPAGTLCNNEVATANGTLNHYLTDQPSLLQAEPAKVESNGQPAAVGDSLPNRELSDPSVLNKAAQADLWTLRVEAVRSMRFDLEGTALFTESSKEESGTVPTAGEGTVVQNHENAISVVERDMLRTEGDPAGSGYTLKEALNLVRSTVPGQRAVALRLIASVLDKALQGLQMQELKPLSFADLKGVVDWQAVWAYALGPEAEIVLTLRLALDDGHSTVVAACARALQALLSYSANESFFDSVEGLWPGDKVVYTAPIFRRKTKHDEGFIGSGRWKYNIKRREMFPFSGTSAQEQVEEEGTDTVGDDGHIANKDVAAGLVRMGLLPRIRYILEVDQLIVADDALLCVLISLSRHSPAAAAAIMSCPRLIDTILHRFVFKHGVESEESWSCQLKAVRLLKVLSQASRSNCLLFEKYGVLEALLRPLSQQPSQESLGCRESLRGFYSTTIETIRFWRVCLSYQIGLSFFSDCYPTLCIWLLPLSEEEILRGCSDPSFTLAIEAYSLLENIARTLPVLHDNLSPTAALAVQLDATRWSWSVAMTMLNTALKWLSPDRIFTVHLLLKHFFQGQGGQVQNRIALRTRIRKILGVLGSLLHFLATVCEKIVSEEELERGLIVDSNFSLPWLPTFVPHLGLAIARSGLLNFARDELQADLSNGELEKTHSLLDFVRYCLSKLDNDSVLVALNCQHAFVRVSSIVDKLIYMNKPKGVSGPADQPMENALLDQGLIVSAEDVLRRWVAVTGTTMASRSSLIDTSNRGGPAPGMGVGWGSLRGGLFSKDVLVAQASARLNLELVSVLSVNPSVTSFGDKASESCVPGRLCCEGTLFDPLWRINTGLALAALANPPNVELVGRGCSMTIFHPASLSFLVDRVVSWGSEDLGGSYPGYSEGGNILKPGHLSKILVQHLETFWLATKSKKAQDSGESRTRRGKPNGSLNSTLPTVHEEGITEDVDSTPQSLMVEFAGQRLPLPSHWFVSPLAIDIARGTTTDSATKTEELEEVVTAGLAFFLGLELLKADISSIGPVIPLVRKIHSLSCVFVTGGDVFLRPLARHLIGSLQDVIGRQLEEKPHSILERSRDEKSLETGIGEEQKEPRVHRDQLASTVETIVPVPSGETWKAQRLDFEGLIDPSYITYAETIAEQFVSSSYGDPVFGRQVALHLWTAAPQNIRLATWRVLADARVLELLPPLSQCSGQASKYLNPVETDQKMLDAYVSAWASGALDKAATRNSLAFRLALHHLGAYIFDEKEVKDAEELLLQRKHARTLVRSTLRRSDRQAMLIRLLVGSAGDKSAGDVKEQVKTRLAFLAEACEGDGILLAEIQRLPDML